MNEIYWITRLDLISGWLAAFAAMSGAVFLVAFIVMLVSENVANVGEYESDREDAKKLLIAWKPYRNTSLALFLFSLPIAILTPDTKDAMLIYGIGNTIDYVKQNNTLQQIPDKCINALDVWVDSLTEKESKNEN
jgi:hypothetical protein